MAGFFALMLSTIEIPSAGVGALEQSNPMLDSLRAICSDMGLAALLLVTSITTKNVLLDLAAIASSRNAHLTSSAQPFVAGPITAMLAAGHQFAADLAATPTILVIGVNAASGDRSLSTETELRGSHLRTRRTRARMAG